MTVTFAAVMLGLAGLAACTELPSEVPSASETETEAGTESDSETASPEQPDSGDAEPAPEPGENDANEAEAEPSEGTPNPVSGSNSGSEADTDASGSATPADLPEGFPTDLGVPFYQPMTLVATPSLGDPWVLEFVTDHELTIVNNTIANEFSEANGWSGVSRTVEGQRTVTTGSKDGYLLVIAVAPEPQDDFKTSLYYTLSTQ